ncbi:FmdB family zinc ribbon protein [Paeniglutamicibacter psychrophenolicus]|uniref:FmdB family zinc ribbon protein n=1 Tax=Paeniglutamicibacter psychrophenolicus TaxID=257454 RepID=UPI00278AA972|nr:zinc ribbon domain-containing protein [Paeniglutamicibacter psychrophenolicus]MDQ0094837.1 putative FmdB family regulatory protein [Paeniglutamicibacter psychrophenolicus]
MPLYEFRCPEGTQFEASFSMSQAPQVLDCPACGQASRRRISAPKLSLSGSAEFKLIDSTKRSAHEPEVVSNRLPAGGKASGSRYTHNPLHQKLPRP